MSTTIRRTRRLAVAALAGTLVYSGAMLLPDAAFADTSGISCTTGSVSDGELVVADGDTCTVGSVSTLDELVVEDGGTVTAPDGYLVNLSVDGVDTGSAYDTWPKTTQSIQPGTYTGEVVLTPSVSHTMVNTETFPIRQALYVDADGVDDDYSVPADLEKVSTLDDTGADDLDVTSTGDGLNGVWVEGGSYTLNDPTITMTGRGRSDFVGAAAGVVADSSTVTVDGADIDNTGTVRTALVSQGTDSNLIVKNSTINAAPSDDLPEGYISNSSTPYMEDTPWKVGVTGSNRATILLGTDSKASYINSSITAADWGALSTDSGDGNTLTSINSTVDAGVSSGTNSGYGTWAIGDATENLLGTTIDAGSYGSVITHNGDADVHWGDSGADSVAELNSSLDLGLTDDELAALSDQPTTVTAGKNAAVFNSEGNLVVDGDTTANAGDAVFMDRGTSTAASVTVDGSEGASFNSDDGIFMQVIDNDNAGTVNKTITVDGTTYTVASSDVTYTDTGEVTYDSSWDLTDADASSHTDVNLNDTTIDDDLYNGARTPKNMVVHLDDTTVKGLITSTDYLHDATTITADNWDEISRVTNTVAAPVNNGVILDLENGSRWVVPGTSYLTSLTGASASSIVGADGQDVTVTIDGVDYAPSDLDPDTTYTGSYGDPIIVGLAGSSATSTTAVKLSPAKVAFGKSRTAVVTVSGSGSSTPSGTVKVLVDGTKVATGTLNSAGRARVALPKTTKVGTHTVTARYTGDDDNTASASTAQLKVTKASSTSRLTLNSHRVTTKKRVKATFRVTVSGVAPTGVIRVLEGGKLLTSYRLKAGAAGKLTKALPKITEAGTYRLRIVYGGNANVARSVSTPVRLRVTR
ncbi:MAG: Ig-like domain-containing protein [Nocardioides sp.]|uniref:Ig-like domain repeat protein n=1 Tax=Nocardioides sp. TaxID=35761 RepID=UPI0039E496CC